MQLQPQIWEIFDSLEHCLIEERVKTDFTLWEIYLGIEGTVKTILTLDRKSAHVMRKGSN